MIKGQSIIKSKLLIIVFILFFYKANSQRIQEYNDCAIERFNENDFEGAQRLCHKIHPFLAQLNAEYLCDVLRKMDKLRGKDASAFPEWKEELAITTKELKAFADKINTDHLR